MGATYIQPQNLCPQCGTRTGRTVAPGKAVCNQCYRSGNYFRASSVTSRGVLGRVADVSVENLSKKLKNRYLMIIILLAAGILVVMISGGQFTFLGAALIIYAFMDFLPSERDILRKVKAGQYLEIAEHMGPLFARAMMKFIIYFLIILQCFMINQPVPALIATFFAYFSMPTSYRTSRPYKAIEAWMRMGFGFLLAMEMYATFSFQGSASFLVFLLKIISPPLGPFLLIFELFTNPAACLSLLTLAFFLTFPKRIEDEDEHRAIYIGIGIGRRVGGSMNQLAGESSKLFSNILFVLLAFMAGLPILSWFTGVWSNFQIVFIIVWIMSLIVGWIGGPEGRPFVGIIVIAFSLFAFSTALPGYVGQAIFGVWWPQVESVITTVTEPLGPLWTQMSSGMSDAWLMLTNPMLYYQKQMQAQQASTSILTTGGKSTSVEINGFDLGGVTILDPAESLLGTIEIENKGEFDANRINLTLQSMWRNATLLSETPVGSFSKITCSGDGAATSVPNNIVGCEWATTTYPAETKIVTFKLEKDDSSNFPNGPWGILSELVNNTMYTHGGTSVKINAYIDYDYNVNVSVPVEIINNETYEKLVQAKQITLKTMESQYSGGPVKATLWSQKQPLRSGEESLIRVYIKNEGIGNITKISSYIVYVPDILNPSAVESSSFASGCPETPITTFNPAPERPGYKKITCTSTVEIASSDFGKVSFYINPPANVTFERKTFLIVGIASYSYKKTTSTSLQTAMIKHST
jgi:uncharacterized OB-fold protein